MFDPQEDTVTQRNRQNCNRKSGRIAEQAKKNIVIYISIRRRMKEIKKDRKLQSPKLNIANRRTNTDTPN